MKLGFLGMGSAGKRHHRNAQSLRMKELRYYDPRSLSLPFREKLINWADAVVIASPSEYHLQDLADCVDAGKHVLVEKPIGIVGQSNGIAKVLKRAKKQGTIVATGFNLRFHPLVHNLLHSSPYYASFVCCQAPTKDNAGLLNDWVCHELDLAQFLIGPLCWRHQHTTDRAVNIFLDKDECQVHIHSDMRAKERLRTITLAGDDYVSCVDLEAHPVTEEHYCNELQSFIERIDGAPDPTLATGEDGLSVLRLCEQVDAAND